MISLESYLRDEYQTDKQQLERTHRVIKSVIPIFHDRFMVTCEGVRTWPYRLSQGKPRPLKKFSDSTHCMISFALNAILQGVDPSVHKMNMKPVLFPAKIRGPKLSLNDLSDIVNRALADIITKVQRRRNPLVSSRTYGQNDPMTLTWFAELLLRNPGPKRDSSVRDKTRRAAVEVCRRRPGVLSFDSGGDGPRHAEIPHSFLRVRVRHLAKVAARLKHADAEPLKTPGIGLTTFEDELHRQMGYFTIPDSRFDPAVLVFALEGALQFDPYALSDSTVESFFQTLEESQTRNPYWRPVTPFLADSQGMVLFPVSVEISNSLLRSYELLHDAARPTHFSQLESLLRRYVQWLLARAERIPYVHDEHGAVGWHSEHVNEPGTIHMWETSQVLLFLVHYSSLLQRKIAAEGLTHAGLRPRDRDSIKPAEGYWNDEPLVALSRIGGTTNTGAAVDDGNRHYAVLSKVRENFIEKGTSTSMLLYGPPGTGKTTLAEQMALSLQQRLLIITVSDFLASGAAEVEARAKGVFQVLQEQEGVIILFDEIDQFLLDRNSDRYRAQTGIFQFLTPGMLTKLQDLKDLGRSIFIVATNYEERIDSAIKRQGRFDDRLLLSLPDKARRREFLWMFLGEKLKNKKDRTLRVDAAARRHFNALTETNDLLKATVLFGYGDLKYLVKNCLRIVPGDTWRAVAKRLSRAGATVQPAVKLSAYASRFDKLAPNEQTPSEEFAILLYLLGECGARVQADDETLVSSVYGAKRATEIVKPLPGSDKVKRALSTAIDKARRSARPKQPGRNSTKKD